MSLFRPVAFFLLTLVSASVVLVSCSLIEDDGNGGGGGDVGGARVTVVQVSNEVGPDGALVNPRNAFPPGTREIRASVRLEGAETGMRVAGKWFQLGTENAGAEGAEVSGSEVTLDETTVSEQGNSRLSFSLATNGPSLPADSWLLRVYVNDVLVKTSGFVITPLLAAAEPQPAPAGTEPEATNYTVVPGDTLTVIAQRFVPAGQNVNDFLIRLAAENSILAGAQLTPGQVITIPSN